MISKPILAAILTFIGGAVLAQPMRSAEPRMEMSVEWVKTSRPILKPLGEAPVALAPGASLQTPATPEVAEADRAVTAVWSIEPSDKLLSNALQRWAGQAGWHLVWEAERDFLIDAALHIEGNFLSAIDTAMRSLAETDYPLQAIANSKTRVLRVARYQDVGAR